MPRARPAFCTCSSRLPRRTCPTQRSFCHKKRNTTTEAAAYAGAAEKATGMLIGAGVQATAAAVETSEITDALAAAEENSTSNNSRSQQKPPAPPHQHQHQQGADQTWTHVGGGGGGRLKTSVEATARDSFLDLFPQNPNMA